MHDVTRRPHSAVQCDCFRQCGSFTWGNVIKLFLVSRTFRPIVTMRLYQWADATPGPIGLILRLPTSVLHRLTCHLAAIDLPKAAQIDAAFTIIHGWGAVIDGEAQIGNNVTIFHGVTIGQVDRVDENGVRRSLHATIGDGVWIGPNAAVLGGVTIGNGARILAGSVVTSSVPAHAVVAGNPGRIVMRGLPEDVWNKVPEHLLGRPERVRNGEDRKLETEVAMSPAKAMSNAGGAAGDRMSTSASK